MERQQPKALYMFIPRELNTTEKEGVRMVQCFRLHIKKYSVSTQ